MPTCACPDCNCGSDCSPGDGDRQGGRRRFISTGNHLHFENLDQQLQRKPGQPDAVFLKSLYVYIFSAMRSFLRKGGEENADDLIPGWAVTSLFRSTAGVVAVGLAAIISPVCVWPSKPETLSPGPNREPRALQKKVAMLVVIAFCHVLDTYLLQSETALAGLAFFGVLLIQRSHQHPGKRRPLGGPPAGKASVDS